jgi:hypothetical protein
MDKQIDFMTLLGVHSIMHIVHPNYYACISEYMNMVHAE